MDWLYCCLGWYDRDCHPQPWQQRQRQALILYYFLPLASHSCSFINIPTFFFCLLFKGTVVWDFLTLGWTLDSPFRKIRCSSPCACWKHFCWLAVSCARPWIPTFFGGDGKKMSASCPPVYAADGLEVEMEEVYSCFHNHGCPALQVNKSFRQLLLKVEIYHQLSSQEMIVKIMSVGRKNIRLWR